jgi:hypothetical protein
VRSDKNIAPEEVQLDGKNCEANITTCDNSLPQGVMLLASLDAGDGSLGIREGESDIQQAVQIHLTRPSIAVLQQAAKVRSS